MASNASRAVARGTTAVRIAVPSSSETEAAFPSDFGSLLVRARVTNANQGRGRSSGSAAADGAARAGSSPAHVGPTARDTATRSPRIALLVAAAPAPGP